MGFKSFVFYFSTKRFHQYHQDIKITPWRIYQRLLYQEKTVYPISPTLFPRPAHWHKQVKVIGHFERNKPQHYSPHNTLSDFLAKHNKILFISFGSISSPHPEEKTNAILHVLEKHHIPTIINTSWGGLIQPESYPDHIYFVERIPYEWILPKVYAMVHHGGAGTTHSALKFACPSLVIPHFIDQFFWAKKVVKLGAGPPGISIKGLTAENFEKMLLDLWNNGAFKEKASWIAAQMNQEGDVEGLMNLIEQT